LLKRVRKL